MSGILQGKRTPVAVRQNARKWRLPLGTVSRREGEAEGNRRSQEGRRVRDSGGVTEDTRGNLYSTFDPPQDSSTLLFNKTYLHVIDQVSARSVKVKIPASFPPEEERTRVRTEYV
jgi:hypothetical protein